MTFGLRRPVSVPEGTRLANAVDACCEAVARHDAVAVDEAYRAATSLASDSASGSTGSPDLWSALAADHVAQLTGLGRFRTAALRCDEYLESRHGDQIPLRLLRAEIYSACGSHSGAVEDVEAVRSALRQQTRRPAADDEARLRRVEGLAAADQDEWDRAAELLGSASAFFAAAGNPAGVARVQRDVLIVQVRRGDQAAVAAAVAEATSGRQPQSVSDCLLWAMALRREQRYEAGLEVLRDVEQRFPDAASQWPLWRERVALLRLLRNDDALQRALPHLRHAARTWLDPTAASAAVAELAGDAVLSPRSATNVPDAPVSFRFDDRVEHARQLIIASRVSVEDALLGDSWSRLSEAAAALRDIETRSRTNRDAAIWHLAVGELSVALSRYPGVLDGYPGGPDEAPDPVGHLAQAVRYAAEESCVEIWILALRLLGRAHAERGDGLEALRCWADARRVEERVAGRQLTDLARARILQEATDEYDEWIRHAVAGLARQGPEAAAAVVVPIEAARGAAILDRILPGRHSTFRKLPGPGDVSAAVRWIRQLTVDLPRSQVFWLMHAGPDRIHHVLLGRRSLRYHSVAVGRSAIIEVVDKLKECWQGRDRSDEAAASPKRLEESIRNGEFDELLTALSAQIGVQTVIDALPGETRRIAIVAGGVLSEVPFSAMPDTTAPPGAMQRLGLRFALSDLPCLSVWRPLRRRSRRIPGGDTLLVSPVNDLSPSAANSRATVLDDAATPAEIRAALHDPHYCQIRIDSHGQHDPADPMRSVLILGPGQSDDAYLRPEELQDYPLHNCGVLVLGACESGMAQRIGQDERFGFVRAAVHAGVPSVVAARWIAQDSAAAYLLDRFELHLRTAPRDVALLRAQRELCSMGPGAPADLRFATHPARWACWTLYGDSGWQPGTGWTARLRYRIADWWQGHATRAERPMIERLR